LWKVTIDGSTTAANLCQTAQQVVDEGSYPSTVLVAGGGTLSPADRVINCYAASGQSWDFPMAAASGLSSATHTLILTSTGFTRTGTSGNRAYLTGFSYAVGTETPVTAGVEILPAITTQPAYSAHEGVEAIYPFGTSSYTDYIGRIHGYEVEDSLAFVIDGTPTTITDGTTVSAGTATVINQVSHTRHPAYGGGTAHFADIVSTFTLHSEGLDVEQVKTTQPPRDDGRRLSRHAPRSWKLRSVPHSRAPSVLSPSMQATAATRVRVGPGSGLCGPLVTPTPRPWRSALLSP